jgi:hypothetical protein
VELVRAAYAEARTSIRTDGIGIGIVNVDVCGGAGGNAGTAGWRGSAAPTELLSQKFTIAWFEHVSASTVLHTR